MKSQTCSILQEVPWIGVVSILLAGILVSTMIIFADPNRNNETISTSDLPIYTLTFVDERGDLLEQQEVHAGGFAVPPKMESYNDGIAFCGWSQKLYDINRSTEMYPVYQNLHQEQNVFYIDSQVAQLGDELEANLFLSGIVRLSSINLILEYDSEVLLDFVCDVEESPFAVLSEEPGKVVLGLKVDRNLAEPLTAAVLRFRIDPERDDIARSRIHIEMKSPAMITEEGEVGTSSRAVHGDIFLLS